MAEKANSAASTSGEAMSMPMNSRFWDGAPFDPAQGGIVTAPSGVRYSVSDPHRVPESGYNGPTQRGNEYFVAKNRVGRLIPSGASGREIADGFEIELSALDEDGRPSQIVEADGNGGIVFRGRLQELDRITPELHDHLLEWGSPVTYSPEEMREVIFAGLRRIVDAGAAEGCLIVPIEVQGQRPFTPKDRTPHRYMDFTAEVTEPITGFSLDATFAVCAVQNHRKTREDLVTRARAMYLEQFVNPLLAAPTLDGAFYAGSRTMNMAGFTEQQLRHMKHVGITPQDLRGPAISHRYKLRRLGSPSAGIWMRRQPATEEEYYAQAHQALHTKRASSADRLMGEHTDRLRETLGTRESSNQGNVGHLDKMPAHGLAANAVYSSIEGMLARGEQPERIFPELFAWAREGEQGLHKADRLSLDVHRRSMDARYNGKPVHDYAGQLWALAQYRNDGGVPEWAAGDFFSSYVPNEFTRKNLRAWCRETGKAPSMAAFYETGIGVPGVYSHEIFNYFREKYPAEPESEIIRRCELDKALAWQRHVELRTAKIGALAAGR